MKKKVKKVKNGALNTIQIGMRSLQRCHFTEKEWFLLFDLDVELIKVQESMSRFIKESSSWTFSNRDKPVPIGSVIFTDFEKAIMYEMKFFQRDPPFCFPPGPTSVFRRKSLNCAYEESLKKRSFLLYNVLRRANGLVEVTSPSAIDE